MFCFRRQFVLVPARERIDSRVYEKHARSGPLFDIGGGNSAVSKHLSENGVPCVLVEPGRSGALNAKCRGVSNVVQSTFQDAGFLPETIDHIGLFDVVERIEDDVEFMSEVWTYQKPGRFAFLTVPSNTISLVI
jgi:hypothetical protein